MLLQHRHHHYLYLQGMFPTVNTTLTKLPLGVTPMSARSYSESTDQEMDIWLKLSLSPSSTVIKTISFTVTPFLITCGGKHLGYRKCGKAGHCIREKFFCDGTVNCGVRNSVWPSGTGREAGVSGVMDGWGHFLYPTIFPLESCGGLRTLFQQNVKIFMR